MGFPTVISENSEIGSRPYIVQWHHNCALEMSSFSIALMSSFYSTVFWLLLYSLFITINLFLTINLLLLNPVFHERRTVL